MRLAWHLRSISALRTHYLATARAWKSRRKVFVCASELAQGKTDPLIFDSPDQLRAYLTRADLPRASVLLGEMGHGTAVRCARVLQDARLRVIWLVPSGFEHVIERTLRRDAKIRIVSYREALAMSPEAEPDQVVVFDEMQSVRSNIRTELLARFPLNSVLAIHVT